MKNYQKYTKQYYLPPVRCMDWAEKDAVDHAPVWCSVDLRDGNQALIRPMTLRQKVEYFKLLLKVGFKEIEVGFPAASDTEYNFLRTLIEEDLIPDDVTVQVLTQAREHIIRKTFEAIRGAKNVIVHVYNSTSVAQREQVFKKDKEAIKKIAVEGAKLLKQLTDEAGAKYRFEYSPESFSGTEPEYALEVCNAVLDVWQPTADRKAVINIPTTVENAMPHVFAQQCEYMSKNLKYRENVLLSLHPHNDRGCAVATAEMGLLAGADRVEGTLFGNGERTGNVDIVTVGMNMYSQGVDPQLDFSFMPEICARYTEYTEMEVSPRQPYGGALVFAAFSGSHQDAIAKGMEWRKQHDEKFWTVPYLPLDPQDVGREYQTDVIRINSQSGKGGVGYILRENFGIDLPPKFKEAMGYAAKGVSDKTNKELKPAEVFAVFEETFVKNRKVFDVPECHFKQLSGGGIEASVTIAADGRKEVVTADGNGRLNAVANALQKKFGAFALTTYEQVALSDGSGAKALSFVGAEKEGKTYWGAGIHEDIIQSSIDALVSALNNCLAQRWEGGRDAGFYVPVRIVGGENCVRKGAQHFAPFGQLALIVCGRSAARNGALDDVKAALAANGQRSVVYDAIPQNPTVASVYEGARIARENRVNFVVAIGGGSPMDAAKAIAMLACQDAPEGLFAHPIGNAVLPMIHIPTTAGTGSEVTPYAIITNDEAQTKQSISSPALFPHIAFLDGKYMAQLPQDITVNTAIDAISHAVEGMLSVRAGGMSDLFAKQALILLMGEYESLLAGSYTPAGRQNLLYGSTLAGMVIANTGTTPVHGMGYSLTYFHGVPHGRANGLLLPNFLKECEKIWKGSTAKVYDALGMDAQEFAQKIKALLGRHKKLPEETLRDYAARAAKNKNVRNCRVPFNEESLYAVLKRSVG